VVFFVAIQNIWLKEEIPNWLARQGVIECFKTPYDGGTIEGDEIWTVRTTSCYLT
jgi:hypothetical protein